MVENFRPYFVKVLANWAYYNVDEQKIAKSRVLGVFVPLSAVKVSND